MIGQRHHLHGRQVLNQLRVEDDERRAVADVDELNIRTLLPRVPARRLSTSLTMAHPRSMGPERLDDFPRQRQRDHLTRTAVLLWPAPATARRPVGCGAPRRHAGLFYRIFFGGCREPPSGSDFPMNAPIAGRDSRGVDDMRYMLMMHAPRGNGRLGYQEPGRRKTQGPHRVHDAASTRSSTQSGELVGAEGLAMPRARRESSGRTEGRRAGGHRRAVRRGQGVPRRLLDRRLRAARSAPTRSPHARRRRPGPGGVPLNMPIEVRQVMSGRRPST